MPDAGAATRWARPSALHLELQVSVSNRIDNVTALA
jgi:hypothetical protein